MSRVQLVGVALGAIILVAIGFRYYSLVNNPPGLLAETAQVVDEVRAIQAGQGGGSGYANLAAIVLPTKFAVWEVKAVSAALGVLTVVLLFFATRPWYGNLSGLYASLFMAVSMWHVTVSRSGVSAVLIPLSLALLLAGAGWVVTWHKKMPVGAYLGAALAGVGLAAGSFVSIWYAAVVLVLLIVALVLLLAALHPKVELMHLETYWQYIVLAVMVAAIVATPLVQIYLADHAALERELQHGVGESPLGQKVHDLSLTLFTSRTMHGWDIAAAGYPLLSPLVSLLFLVGLVWALIGCGRVGQLIIGGRSLHLSTMHLVVVLLVASGTAVVVITGQLGALILLAVPVYLLAGAAASVCTYWLRVHLSSGSRQGLLYGGVAGVLILQALYSGGLVFMIPPRDSAAQASYHADLTVVASYLNSLPEGVRPTVLVTEEERTVLETITTAGNWLAANPTSSHLLVIDDGSLVVFTQDSLSNAERFAQEHEAAVVVGSERNFFNQEVLRVYEVRGAVQGIQGEQQPAPVDYGLDA